jgi:trans-2,3-dihydro-3-hydroxyanthranilate isomerase
MPPSFQGVFVTRYSLLFKTMRFRYYTCDVFTDTRFGGNPLAVLPEASGLSDSQMQQIAMEFGFSETTFVLPARAGNTRQVRIFTPIAELPFAGHPNVGTAFVLAAAGELGTIDAAATVRFEEGAGIVPVRIEPRGESFWCELEAPARLSIGKPVTPEALAAAVSLDPVDVVTSLHPPEVASVGLPFVIAQLRNRKTLGRARPNLAGYDALEALSVPPAVLLYIRSEDEVQLRARMFAPLDRVPEDPATGSANCALAGLLASLNPAAEGEFSYRIAQGVEMGRPSLLEARARKEGGQVTGVWIGGTCVMVSEGWITV